MANDKNKPVGWSKDAGFMVGARKTVPLTLEDAWERLFSPTWLKIWLKTDKVDDWTINEAFTTPEGLFVKVTTLNDLVNIRMQWKPSNWKNTSIVQIRVIPNKTSTLEKPKSTIAFMQEKMLDENQRNEMKAYWQNVLSAFTKEIKNNQ